MAPIRSGDACQEVLYIRESVIHSLRSQSNAVKRQRSSDSIAIPLNSHRRRRFISGNCTARFSRSVPLNPRFPEPNKQTGTNKKNRDTKKQGQPLNKKTGQPLISLFLQIGGCPCLFVFHSRPVSHHPGNSPSSIKLFRIAVCAGALIASTAMVARAISVNPIITEPFQRKCSVHTSRRG